MALFNQKYSFEALQNGNKKKYPWLLPGSAKSKTYAGKSKKRGFLKKNPVKIEKKNMF